MNKRTFSLLDSRVDFLLPSRVICTPGAIFLLGALVRFLLWTNEASIDKWLTITNSVNTLCPEGFVCLPIDLNQKFHHDFLNSFSHTFAFLSSPCMRHPHRHREWHHYSVTVSGFDIGMLTADRMFLSVIIHNYRADAAAVHGRLL